MCDFLKRCRKCVEEEHKMKKMKLFAVELTSGNKFLKLYEKSKTLPKYYKKFVKYIEKNKEKYEIIIHENPKLIMLNTNTINTYCNYKDNNLTCKNKITKNCENAEKNAESYIKSHNNIYYSLKFNSTITIVTSSNNPENGYT